MKRTIWKFPIKIQDDVQKLVVRGRDARPLTVQMQGGVPTVWIELTPIDSGAATELHVRVVPTGREFVPSGEYLGTVQEANGALIWHVYVG